MERERLEGHGGQFLVADLDPGRVIPGEEGPVVAGGFPAGVMAGAIPGELTTDDVAAIVAYLESL